jgi:steroid delta-isomerase-like uncharacterized protein
MTTAAADLSEGAEQIPGGEWLADFAARYLDAWNSLDPRAVAALTADDVLWADPALARPARGRDEVAAFVAMSARGFPDLSFAETGTPAISADARVAYVPWRMTGTNSGPIDPPGLAPTGRAIAIDGIDVWRFRDGLIWRYAAVYDSTEMSRQLGLAPARGGSLERAMAGAQRLSARLRRAAPRR